jgi:predicted transcriptional regulator
MSVKTHQEIEVWYVIPAIRREMVLELKKRKVSQKAAARLLCLTEAAVSQYMSGKRGTDVRFGPDMRSEIRKSVDSIQKGAGVMEEIHRLTSFCKSNGTLCRLHRKMGDVPKECRMCLE